MPDPCPHCGRSAAPHPVAALSGVFRDADWWPGFEAAMKESRERGDHVTRAEEATAAIAAAEQRGRQAGLREAADRVEEKRAAAEWRFTQDGQSSYSNGVCGGLSEALQAIRTLADQHPEPREGVEG